MVEGFGTWHTLDELRAAIREQANAQGKATGTRPTEIIVGADVAVALDRFGFQATGEVRRLKSGVYAHLGDVEGLAVLTPLRPESGCGGCQMGCRQD